MVIECIENGIDEIDDVLVVGLNLNGYFPLNLRLGDAMGLNFGPDGLRCDFSYFLSYEVFPCCLIFSREGIFKYAHLGCNNHVNDMSEFCPQCMQSLKYRNMDLFDFFKVSLRLLTQQTVELFEFPQRNQMMFMHLRHLVHATHTKQVRLGAVLV